MNKIQCPKCGSENAQTINVQKEIQKEAKTGFVILFTLFAVFAIIGVIITISNALNMIDIKAYRNSNETNDIITSYILYLLQYEQYKAKVFLGIGLFLLGFSGTIFTAIFYNIDPTYKVKNESQRICVDCGKKWKIKTEEINLDTNQNPQ